MTDLLQVITPYFPLVYILVQLCMYLLIRNDMLRMWIRATDRFVTKRGYVER